MQNREKLVQDYIKVQRDLATQKERLLQMQNDRDEKKKMLERTENYIKNLECIGNPVGYVLQKISDEKIIVKAASGPRYVVGCRPKINTADLKPGTRPHKARVRPLNPAQEADLKRQLGEWLEAKIIEPTSSE